MRFSLGPDESLILEIESTVRGAHHIAVPLTLDGLRIIKRVLRERRKPGKIGTRSSPTQSMVEEWLRAAKAEREANAAKQLEDLGIDLGDLGL